MSFELPKPDDFCHHTGFEKSCRELVTSGKCKRWRDLPGADPFTGEQRSAWGCVDNLVLLLQGEAMRQSNGAHTAMTEFKEMAFNPEYRARKLREQHQMKTIEAKT